MAGEIKHSWTGTVLTITSDSGTSSCDLKGDKGDRGIRGAQGRAGVILNADGSVNMEGYATEAYVEDLFSSFEGGGSGNVDLSNYYTKAEIDATIAELELSGGGGGSTPTNNAILTLTNREDWLSKSIAEGASCTVSAAWSSVENGIPTGAGILTVTVDGVVRHTTSVQQGRFTVNVAPYLTVGTNSVRVAVQDVYGNVRPIIYSITVVSLILQSKFDSSVPYEGVIPFTYVPIGSVKKTVHFILDGVTIGSTSVATSGRQQTFNIPAQEHGSHTFEVYFESDIDGETIPSNHLYYDLICIESGVTTPIIACDFNQKEMQQFETVNIDYYVYNPTSLTSEIILKANDVQVGNPLTVDRTKQTWGYRAEDFGDLTLSITCGNVVKVITLTVDSSAVDVEAVTDNLELYLTSYGRSNNESEPNSWTYGDVACSFSNYNWISDGWLMDSDGIAVHRVTGDARLTIPLKIFKNDFRGTGKTIEFEFATRDIRDYDAVIVSCMSGDIGFQMTAQEAILKSEQAKLSTQYKEDEHIRLTFVVEKRAENKLIYIYLNGIMCGATQYPDDDDFSQGIPVDISIGSNLCTIDLYNIRVYNNDLTRYQVLDNWIADTQNIEEKVNRFNRNNIYDAYGSIIISQLPKDLPYLILEAPILPQFKDNVLPVSGSYVNHIDSNKNFTFKNAEADVQGTTSAGYARKNYKIKFVNGITQGTTAKETYQMREDSIPTDMFTFKADVASSEGANNVELVRLYDRISPYKTPPQLEDSRVRQGIDGFPIVIFHDDGKSTNFIGKYNFNNDKGTPEVFGMNEDDESWEIRNNTSSRANWKSADFSGSDWENDFEARHPKDNKNTTNLAHFAEWVVSTDREQATNEDITPVVYDGVEYTKDTADYRLAKFKAEIEDYAELQSALFYYLFTELFLMVDSRAKNAFPTFYDGSGKVCWLPYDMDTAIGINNEGDLVFGYELEDIDKTDAGENVYNGQNSVFWCNLRDSFRDEIQTMYQNLRSTNKLSYDEIENAYEEHQSKWSEAIWNEDAYYKYLEPLIVDGAGIYLPMLQGSKSEQRKWWLYNRFRYMDSKYVAGDSLKEYITLRGYEKSDITLEPYADIYASIKYGSYMVQARALRGDSYTLECPLDTLSDTEIYIYSASQLKDIGDISGFKVGLADFSMSPRLQNLKIGDGAADYDNSNLLSLTLGNNVLLNSLDVRNCSMFGTGEQQALDVSGCSNIEHIYLEGTALKSVTLPKAGILKTLHLPDTVTTLRLVNQTALTDFSISGYSNISTLRLENTPIVDTLEAFRGMKENGRVRLTNIDWTFDSYEECVEVLTKLDGMRGLDENDNNTSNAQISGVINVPWKCAGYISEWEATYPTIDFVLAPFSLEKATWAEIEELAYTDIAQEVMKVGDEKTVELSDGEIITVVLYGFNHDTIYDSNKKAALTFGLKNCLKTQCEFEGTTTNNKHYYCPYSASDIDNFVSSYYGKFPRELSSVIKPVTKQYYWKDYVFGDAIMETSRCLTFLFSHIEVMGSTSYKINGAKISTGGGEQYEYFKNAPIPEGMMPMIEGSTTGTFYNPSDTAKFVDKYGKSIGVSAEYLINYNAIKGLGDDATSAVSWWTRSGVTYPETGWIGSVYIMSAGVAHEYHNNVLQGVNFGFCI